MKTEAQKRFKIKTYSSDQKMLELVNTQILKACRTNNIPCSVVRLPRKIKRVVRNKSPQIYSKIQGTLLFSRK